MTDTRSDSLFKCRHHGRAFTFGCPGCQEAVDRQDDADLAKTVRERLRWWKITNLCSRFLGHVWKELEPGAFECRVCHSLLFSGDDADGEAIYRVLGGHTSTCSWWASNPPNCTCGAQR